VRPLAESVLQILICVFHLFVISCICLAVAAVRVRDAEGRLAVLVDPASPTDASSSNTTAILGTPTPPNWPPTADAYGT